MSVEPAALRTHHTSAPRGETGIRSLTLWVGVGLATAFAARALLAWWAVHSGYVEYNADGFTRSLRGYEWLIAPRWEVSVWPPLQSWLYGGVLWLWDDIYLAPRVMNFTLGLGAITLLFGAAALLAGWRAGLIAAVLVALLPLEVWLSISGMSEPLFHFLIALGALGAVAWWLRVREWPLLVAGVAFGLASAVRYEGWFYVAAFIALVACAWLLDRRDWRYPAAAAALAMVFIGVWLQQNAQIHGDPISFVRQTEQIRFVEDPANLEAGFLDRIAYFPSHAARVAPLLVAAGVASSALLLWRDWRRWAGLLALVWGQATLLVAITAPFASLGPGVERFLLSNLLLLTIPVAGAITMAWRAWGRAGPAFAAGSLILLLASYAPDWRTPPAHYPAPATRDAAAAIREGLAHNPDDAGLVMALLPAPPAEQYNEGYALRVLARDPGRVVVTHEASRLYEAVIQGDLLMWVVHGDAGVNLPAAERLEETGTYILGWPPPPAHAEIQPRVVVPGETARIDGSGFLPHEPMSTWWTGPDGSVQEGPVLNASERGAIDGAQVAVPETTLTGEWALTISGQESQRQAIVQVEVRP
jgi:hypothetical protein